MRAISLTVTAAFVGTGSRTGRSFREDSAGAASLEQVLAACLTYHGRKRRMVFVEYVMLAGVNDSRGQAVQLAEVLDPHVFKVNLIPYNPTGSTFQGSSPKAIEAFRAALAERGVSVTVRLTRGREIEAACGQLAARAAAPALAAPIRASAAR